MPFDPMGYHVSPTREEFLAAPFKRRLEMLREEMFFEQRNLIHLKETGRALDPLRAFWFIFDNWHTPDLPGGTIIESFCEEHGPALKKTLEEVKCGTIGCAMGLAHHLWGDKSTFINDEAGVLPHTRAAEYFGVSEGEYGYIFLPSSYGDRDHLPIEPKEVATHITAVLNGECR